MIPKEKLEQIEAEALKRFPERPYGIHTYTSDIQYNARKRESFIEGATWAYTNILSQAKIKTDEEIRELSEKYFPDQKNLGLTYPTAALVMVKRYAYQDGFKASESLAALRIEEERKKAVEEYKKSLEFDLEQLIPQNPIGQYDDGYHTGVTHCILKIEMLSTPKEEE